MENLSSPIINSTKKVTLITGPPLKAEIIAEEKIVPLLEDLEQQLKMLLSGSMLF
jgi:hypothetical protein